MYRLLFIICSIVVCSCQTKNESSASIQNDSEVIVEYEQGVLRGRMDKDREGVPFYSFQGIPYAKPPLNGLRFKDPEPFGQWDKNEVWDGTKEGSRCLQKLIDQSVIGDEDCLFVNVYTRNIAKDYAPPKHVLVWFHGGSFVEGSGNTDIHGPKYIVSENFVLVTFNYRLGVFGFLNIDDPSENVTGNAALKDQLLVLRWVQQYIHNFGGDSTKVTIAGNSAGGMSVDLQMFSDYSRERLFNRAISQSAPLLLFDITEPAPGWAKDLAILMQFDPQNNSTQDLYEFLKFANPKGLIEAQTKLSGVQNTKNYIKPIVEPYYAKNRFLKEPPIDTIRRGNFRKIPYLKGMVDQESMFVLLYIALDPNLIPQTVEDYERYLPRDMGLVPGSNKSLEIAGRVKARYYDSSEDIVQGYLNLVSDTSFILPINEQVKEMVKVLNKNQLFYYVFTLDTELNLFKRQLNITTQYKGAAHTDEKGYLFNYDGSPSVAPGGQLSGYIDRMLLLWTNFAKFGNPNGNGSNPITINWPSVTPTELNYIKIDKTLTTNIKPFADRIAFWDHLYASINNTGYFTRANPANFCILVVPVLMASVLFRV